MQIQRITPEEALRLQQDEGYALVDVRSMPEYLDGHPSGAYNIPFLHKTPSGMIPNPDFRRVVAFRFPDKASKIVLTGKMGSRSLRAANDLASLGYTGVLDMIGGFLGEMDEDGGLVNAGWQGLGLPSEEGEPQGFSYKSLNQEANQNEGAKADPVAPRPEVSALTAFGAGPNQIEDEGMNRFASSHRKVHCIRFGRELPGLKRRPYPGELGERLYHEVSALAWNAWVEHAKMVVNEYRLSSVDAAALALVMEQCEAFFYGDGLSSPEGYVPMG